MIGTGSDATRILDFLEEEAAHLSEIFPEDSNETVTFTAGGVADTFGAWAEIIDNNGVTLSSKLADCEGHISSYMVEDANVKDKIYIFEIAYGDDKIIIDRSRILSGNVKLSTTQQVRSRGGDVPSGETVFYRMKCETAGKTVTLSMRYHCH